MSDEPVSTGHDPNYKWRVIGAISTVLLTAFAVTMTAIFSGALSAGHITGLFGMEFAIVLIVIIFVLRSPSSGWHSSASQRWFDMDNPLLGVPLSILAGILVSLFTNWLGTK
jgi:hypothetical protein